LKTLITFNFLKHLLIESYQPQNQNAITVEMYTFNQLKIEITYWVH